MRLANLIVVPAIVTLVAWSAASARADGIVLIAGTATARQRQIVVEAFEADAKSLNWTLTAPSLGRELVDSSLKCLADSAPWTCVAPALRGKDQIVIIQLENDRGSSAPTTIATAHVLIAGIQGEVSASRYCETANDEALRRVASELAKVLQEAAERTGRTTLVIRSKPDKAWITLDGKNVGATERTRATYPGTHTISVRRIGYKAIARDVVAIEGKVLPVDFDLEPDGSSAGSGDPPIGANPPTHSDDRQDAADGDSRLIPKLTVVAGGAAIAAGVFWLAYDENPDPHGPQRQYYHDTATYGYVSLALGAVAAGVGLYFWLRPHATSAVTVAPMPGGGATAAWALRF